MTITVTEMRASLGLPKVCNVCGHEIEPYGFYEYRCVQRCRCKMMIGCVPEAAPDNPNRSSKDPT
jgi:hypothetical protein